MRHDQDESNAVFVVVMSLCECRSAGREDFSLTLIRKSQEFNANHKALSNNTVSEFAIFKELFDGFTIERASVGGGFIGILRIYHRAAA